MNGDGALVARALLKVAAARNVARPIGRALYNSGVAAKKVVQGAGEFGAGIAEGLGAGETGQTVGRLVGAGGAVAAGASTAQKGKRKVDEFRYRHGLYRDGGY